MTSFAIYQTKFGMYRIEYDNGVVTGLRLSGDNSVGGARNELTKNVYIQLSEYFDGKRTSFDFPYELRGTEFQKKVWTELCKIPYGRTKSYKEIAEAIGSPAACRAVGMANNKNPLAIAVPCHRVIGSDGSLTGYASGITLKKALLELERASYAGSN